VPAGGDTFRWRVSVAHIDASGPFSEFAEYNRKMVLLQGAGIDLRFGDGTHKSLRKIGELVEFELEITAGKTVTLEPWDLAVLSHGSGRLHRLETANAFGSTLVFLATLQFVSGE